MAILNQTVLVGVFVDRANARQAVQELRDAGFDDSHLGVAGHDVNDDVTCDLGNNFAGEGTLAGAAAGAGIGALWGLGVLAGTIPAIGPAIAGGTLAALLSSAAAGAATAGLAGSLIGFGVPKEEAEYYETEFRSGRTVVTVNASNREAEAAAILSRNGAYDVTNRGNGSPVAQPTGSPLAADPMSNKLNRPRTLA